MKEFSQMETLSLNEPKCRNSFYSWEKFSLYVTESTMRTVPMQDQELCLEDSKRFKAIKLFEKVNFTRNMVYLNASEKPI